MKLEFTCPIITGPEPMNARQPEMSLVVHPDTGVPPIGWGMVKENDNGTCVILAEFES